eukprot:365885-Chlamydomonas_euryale.AAC.2
MPYASAAAVCVLMRPMTLRPARWAASMIAWRCAWPKNAGTAITASGTGAPDCASAMSLA